MVLYQDKNSYCYNSDTHFLHHFICLSLGEFKNVTGELLDIGSGCGVLGLLVARDFPKLHLNQVEIFPKMQFLTTKNSQINNINNSLFEGDFIQIDFEKQFDICVSNPPFYHGGAIKSTNEHLNIARYNDNMPLEKFIEKVSKILKNNGKFMFCYDVKQLADIILSLKKYNLNIEKLQFMYPKIDKNSALVMVYARKNSKSLCDILPPIIAFDGDTLSNQSNLIYTKSATHSIKVEF